MAGTRSSARQSANPHSSPASAKSSSGTKRKADNSSPSTTKSKRGRPSKEQKTLEETMPCADQSNEHDGSENLPDADQGNGANANGDETVDRNGDGNDGVGEKYIKEAGESFKGVTKHGDSKEDPEKALKGLRGHAGVNVLDQVEASEDDPGKTSKKQEGSHTDATVEKESVGEAVESDAKRGAAQPSNILEKGIIYFFSRGRVGVEDLDSVQDLARSYFVLRPLPADRKITDGAIQDVGNDRLVALPKKVWPKSGRDKFMAFVEKAPVSMHSLKEEFFRGSEYSTKTVGTRHSPPVTPIGEGVYAITSTGGGQGTTHLAYMLTIPSEISEVQHDLGLKEKGSFVLSLKNPESSGPANAQLAQGAEYPKEIMEEFRGRNWMPVAPKHLDYANAQMLLIGEDFDSSNNLEPAPKDKKDESKETPQEELEKLEHEDELRVEHLRGDDTIFADLGLSSKEYPKVLTTW